MTEEQRNEKKEGKSEGSEDWRGDRTSHTDRLEAVGWALFLIWIAVVVVIDITGYKENFSWWNGWTVALTGGGIISIVSGVIRAYVPRLRGKMVGAFIFGLILLAVAWGAWGWFWVLILIAIAVGILAATFRRRR